MAPRRARANSNTTRQPESTAPSDAARYETNLKILRRRDPTIVRIFDQFPHVTVYSYNRTNSKWERYNCEGALFLFERQDAHRYGFYILNRSGMNDYVHIVYPWDDVGETGQYLMVGAYPAYAARMLGPNPPPAAPEDAEDPYAERRAGGRQSDCIGLWMFDSADRAQLTAAMTRLRDAVKQGKPYPSDYMYEYGRRPKPESDEDASSDGDDRPPSYSALAPSTSSSSTPAQHSQGMTVLDQLFANAHKGPAPPPAPHRPQHQASPSASALPHPHPTIESLFASLSPPPPAPAAAAAPAPATGLALLDSIFASAHTSPAPTPGHMNAAFRFPPPAAPAILSPKPRASALPPLLYDQPPRSARGFGVALDEDAEEERTASAAAVDATPRAGPAGLPPAGPPLLQQLFAQAAPPPPQQQPARTAEQPARAAPALADTSALWLSAAPSADEVLELDFADTRVLADAEAFRSAQSKAAKMRKASGPRTQPAPAPAPPAAMPVPVTQKVPPATSPAAMPTSPALSMFVPAQVRQPAKAPPKALNGINGMHAPHGSVGNGRSPGLAPNTPGLSPGMVPNSTGLVHAPLGVNGGLDRDAVRGSLLDALFPPNGAPRAPLGTDRESFAGTLQRLLSQDPAFVETVWRDYRARVGAHL